MPLPFFDVDDFKVINAKFSLDMALAFFNANALRSKNKIKKMGPRNESLRSTASVQGPQSIPNTPPLNLFLFKNLCGMGL